MTKLRTETCCRYGHPEIHFAISDRAVEMSRWVLGYFESAVAGGTRFTAGQTVEIGWVTVRIAEAGGLLELEEPDFESFPIRWVRGLDHTVRFLALQRAVCDELEVGMESVTMLNTAVVCPQWAPNMSDFNMSRDPSDGADSGWVFNCEANTSAAGEWQSLYQISLLQMKVIPFLNLPPGATVSFAESGVSVSVGDRLVSSGDSAIMRDILTLPR
jgi:hypothetical protein